MFEKTLFAGWGDMDFNSHMRNTSFLDRSADVRMMFFAEHGFPMEEFVRRKLGPVILKDELEYFKEVRLLEPFAGWLDLSARRLVVPPDALMAALQSLPKTDDFQELPSNMKGTE